MRKIFSRIDVPRKNQKWANNGYNKKVAHFWKMAAQKKALDHFFEKFFGAQLPHGPCTRFFIRFVVFFEMFQVGKHPVLRKYIRFWVLAWLKYQG